jgi:hypothetical protein
VIDEVAVEADGVGAVEGVVDGAAELLGAAGLGVAAPGVAVPVVAHATAANDRMSRARLRASIDVLRCERVIARASTRL